MKLCASKQNLQQKEFKKRVSIFIIIKKNNHAIYLSIL